MGSSRKHLCPDYDGVPEYGGPCWTCQNDPEHCTLSMAEKEAQDEAEADLYDWWRSQQL